MPAPPREEMPGLCNRNVWRPLEQSRLAVERVAPRGALARLSAAQDCNDDLHALRRAPTPLGPLPPEQRPALQTAQAGYGVPPTQLEKLSTMATGPAAWLRMQAFRLGELHDYP